MRLDSRTENRATVNIRLYALQLYVTCYMPGRIVSLEDARVELEVISNP